MSLDNLLIHTCTIENPVSGQKNVYNNGKKTYATPLTAVHCRLIESRETVEKDEITEAVIQSTYMLMVLGTVEIEEEAKISLVTLEDGTTINDEFEVGSVLVRRGRNSRHKTAMLKRIS